MTPEEAKIVLRSIAGIMGLTGLKNKDEKYIEVCKDFMEAVNIACDAIDMTEDRLNIEDGGKQDDE